MNAQTVERCVVNGPVGQLEAIAEEAIADEAMAALPRRYAVVCHPHPSFGGTMDNKVVVTLARALRDSGIPTLRFNFRGVGRSAGNFDGGVGETDDAYAIAAFGALRWPDQQLIIAGFSFGAYVAMRLALRLDAAQLITVAPPVGKFDFSALGVPVCPWLIVQGDADEVVDVQNVLGWAKTLLPQPQLLVMPGVGHFFHGRLLELRESLRNAVATVRGG